MNENTNEESYDELLVLARDARSTRKRANYWTTGLIVTGMAASTVYVTTVNQQMESLTEAAGESEGLKDDVIRLEGEVDLLRAQRIFDAGGQKRQCTGCKAEHFPRVDPVIICLVTDGERCLLGQSRGRLARQNRYSALAGFVDQGESIEEAVAREIMEEAGLQVRNVRYHSSQPWPFPSSLMMGCHAEAAHPLILAETDQRCSKLYHLACPVTSPLN